MAPKRPKIVEPPKGGLWRVGRSLEPLRFSDPLDPGLLENRTTGNRFDSPTGDYRVCDFATTVEACFGETLSRFRPDPGLGAAANEEGFMALGEVPTDWRHRRLAVRAAPASSKAIPVIAFSMSRRRRPARCSATSSANCSPTTGTTTSTSRQCAAETAGSRAGSAGGPTSSATRTTASSTPASATSRDSHRNGSDGRCSRTQRSKSRGDDPSHAMILR